MIPVLPAEEPPNFNEKVRIPGQRAIAEMVGEKPKRTSGRSFKKRADRRVDLAPTDFPTYWRECIEEMMTVYNRICAYSCFRIHPVTGAASIDHLAPKSRHWDRVYEWENYRLCCCRMNGSKNNFEDVIDPFEVEEHWFFMELVGFEIYPNPKLEMQHRDRIDATIARLGLNRFKKYREDDAERYWKADITFKTLNLESPFVARELIRQNRLLKNDLPGKF